MRPALSGSLPCRIPELGRYKPPSAALLNCRHQLRIGRRLGPTTKNDKLISRLNLGTRSRRPHRSIQGSGECKGHRRLAVQGEPSLMQRIRTESSSTACKRPGWLDVSYPGQPFPRQIRFVWATNSRVRSGNSQCFRACGRSQHPSTSPLRSIGRRHHCSCDASACWPYSCHSPSASLQ